MHIAHKQKKHLSGAKFGQKKMPDDFNRPRNEVEQSINFVSDETELKKTQ
jgi:hypothetical protein